MHPMLSAVALFLWASLACSLAEQERNRNCPGAEMKSEDWINIEKRRFVERLDRAVKRRFRGSNVKLNGSLPSPPAKLTQLAQSQKTNFGKRSVMEQSESGWSPQEKDRKEKVYIVGRNPIRGSTKTASCLSPSGAISTCLEFHLDHETLGVNDQIIERVSLWMYYRMPSSLLRRHPLAPERVLEIHEIHRRHSSGIGRVRSELIGTVSTVDGNSESWIESDVTEMFSTRDNSHHKTRTIRIQWQQFEHTAFPPILLNDSEYMPFLEITFKTISHTDIESVEQNDRVKRNVRSGMCGPRGQACCLHHFYVDFTELGWNRWILFPPGYAAGYCAGTCAHGRDVSNSDDVSNFIRDYISPNAPCCAPKRQSSLQIIYAHKTSEENGAIYRTITLPNMVVNQCQCQ